MKIDVEKVKTLVADAGRSVQVHPEELAKLIARIQDMLPEPEAPEDKPPPQKKQFVVLLSDPLRKIPDGEDFAAWVLQIPERDSPLSTHERIETAAVNFNGSRRGRMLPVQTVGEALENIPAKAFKEVELWCKTKTPVLVVVTRNELPNTPGLSGLSYEIRTADKVVRIDSNGIDGDGKGAA